MSQALLDELRKTRIIPVVALPDPLLAVPLARALLDGGIDWVEITFRTAGASEALQAVKDEGVPIRCGAGTVRTIQQAREAIDAGVSFIVTPGLNGKVVEYIQENSQVPVFPGVDSTLGIETALNLGLKVLKFFPASIAGSVEWLKAVRGPYFDVEFIPTGGVSLKNLAEYLAVPNVVGIGGSFVAPGNLIQAQNWTQITDLCKQAKSIVRTQ